MSIHRALREKSGKEPEPSAAMIDSQSVKTAQMADTRGFDGHKKWNNNLLPASCEWPNLIFVKCKEQAILCDIENLEILFFGLRSFLDPHRIFWETENLKLLPNQTGNSIKHSRYIRKKML